MSVTWDWLFAQAGEHVHSVLRFHRGQKEVGRRPVPRCRPRKMVVKWGEIQELTGY